MGDVVVKYKFNTEEKILSLTPKSEYWVERAFYYPDDKNYFFQAVNGKMKRYGDGDTASVGVGCMINGKVIGGVKRVIQECDTLTIPEYYEYNTMRLQVEGLINVQGNLNILE